jgi:hypothetical protein
LNTPFVAVFVPVAGVLTSASATNENVPEILVAVSVAMHVTAEL